MYFCVCARACLCERAHVSRKTDRQTDRQTELEAQQDGKTHKLDSLLSVLARVESQGRAASNNDQCKMGVPLSDNDGTAFNAANVCDECDVLLTSSRARSDTLCAKHRAKAIARSAKRLVSNKGQASQARTPLGARLDRRMRSQPHHNEFHTRASHDDGDPTFEQIRRLHTDLQALEETFNSTVDELSREVAQLQVQHDWTKVVTGYMTCELGMTWDQILEVMEQQRSSKTHVPDIVTGGLGRRMIPDKFEIWVCVRPDRLDYA